MAMSSGMLNGVGSWVENRSAKRVCRAAYGSSSDGLTSQYRTLRVQPGASEFEVKKAFRQLALQYHPDVCKGSNCGVQFHRINEAYNIVMSNLRGEYNSTMDLSESFNESKEDEVQYSEPDWELWEEWMGWEGAGIRDYSSHINPYI